MKWPMLALIVCVAAGPVEAQDLVAGQVAFGKCTACHDISADAKNRMGPVLTGIVGRVAGTYAGFKYSKGMADAGAAGLVWNPETLDAFLASPKDFIKGTKMNNVSVKDAAYRANIIAYLQDFPADAQEEGR